MPPERFPFSLLKEQSVKAAPAASCWRRYKDTSLRNREIYPSFCELSVGYVPFICDFPLLSSLWKSCALYGSQKGFYSSSLACPSRWLEPQWNLRLPIRVPLFSSGFPLIRSPTTFSLVDTNAVFINIMPFFYLTFFLFCSRTQKYTVYSIYIYIFLSETKDANRFLAPSGSVFMWENAQSQWTRLVFSTEKNNNKERDHKQPRCWQLYHLQLAIRSPTPVHSFNIRKDWKS